MPLDTFYMGGGDNFYMANLPYNKYPGTYYMGSLPYKKYPDTISIVDRFYMTPVHKPEPSTNL